MEMLCKHPNCRNNEIGSSFAVQCGLCTHWYHGTCIKLTPASAAVINENGLEWICVECAVLESLCQQYLRENRLDLAVKYCKKFDKTTIYVNVCAKGMLKITAKVHSCTCVDMSGRARIVLGFYHVCIYG